MPRVDRGKSQRPGKDVSPSSREERSLARAGYNTIAGLDEAGRGCLAGPVVAAAVVLKPEAYELPGRIVDVRDSKLLTPLQREELFAEIVGVAHGIGLGVVPHDFIDACGIVEATRQAMAIAVSNLPLCPDHLLIDYLSLPAIRLPQKPIVYGDSLCLSIAAASIVAKVHRDRLMCEQDVLHPVYGFAQNKGYGTPGHLDALQQHGPCAIHRRSFQPVRECMVH